MGAISRLSEKCSKCPNVRKCNNKRMEACAFMEMPKKLSDDYSAPLTSTLVAPMVRVHNPITIRMGDYGTIDTSMEEIKQKIKKQFYGNMFDVNCSFNKS